MCSSARVRVYFLQVLKIGCEHRSRRAAAQGAAGAWSLLKSKRGFCLDRGIRTVSPENRHSCTPVYLTYQHAGVGPDDACKALSAARPATLGNNADEDLKEGIDKNHEKSSADGGDVSGGGGSECAIAIGDGMPSQGIMRTPVPSPKEQISGKSSNPPKGEKPRGLGIHSKEPRKSCPVCKKVRFPPMIYVLRAQYRFYLREAQVCL